MLAQANHELYMTTGEGVATQQSFSTEKPAS